MNLNKNLIFLGMMGSGKSSIGYLVSKELNIKFKDIDKLIEDDVQPTSTGVVFYVPQSKFVTDKTYIWKFEDGFEQDFLDWIKENIGVSLSIEGYDKNTWKVKTFAHLIHPWYYIQPVISQQVKGHIKRYYKEDYETFDYK